jgi:hypothetical protein
MKYIIFALLFLSLIGCNPEIFRPQGKPFIGYSCRESILHFHSQCSQEKLTKDDFEAKVSFCEKELASNVCDKEQAALLWCMGRVAPGTYSSGGGVVMSGGRGSAGFYTGNTSTSDGCDCSTFSGNLKKCRMELGIFDK